MVPERDGDCLAAVTPADETSTGFCRTATMNRQRDIPGAPIFQSIVKHAKALVLVSVGARGSEVKGDIGAWIGGELCRIDEIQIEAPHAKPRRLFFPPALLVAWASHSPVGGLNIGLGATQLLPQVSLILLGSVLSKQIPTSQ